MTDDITQNDCQGEHMNSDRTGDLELCGGSLLLHEDDQGNIGGLAITGISGGADYIGDFNNGGFPRTLHLRRLDDMAGPDMCYVAEPAAETARLNAELTEAREIIGKRGDAARQVPTRPRQVYRGTDEKAKPTVEIQKETQRPSRMAGNRGTGEMMYFTIGTLIGSGIAVIVAASLILSGWVLTILWAWFVVPLGIAQIGIAHGIGICATGRLIIGRVGSQSDTDKTKDPIERLSQSIGVLLGFPLLALLIGWLAQMFM